MTPVQQRALVAAITTCMFVAAILFGEFPLVKYTPENNRDVFLLMKPSSSSLTKRTLYSTSYLQEQLQNVLHEHRQQHSNQTNITKIKDVANKKLLVCTMLTNDFRNYAAGAAKLAHSILVTSSSANRQQKTERRPRNDVQMLWQMHGIRTELGILEMQVFFSAFYWQLKAAAQFVWWIQERPIPPRIWESLHEMGWHKKFTRPRIKPRYCCCHPCFESCSICM